MKQVRNEANNFGLTPQQLRAVNYLFKGYTQSGALKKAGYSKNVQKDRWSIFGNPYVQKEIKRRKDRLVERNEVTEDWIVQRLAKIAGADPGDLIEVDDKGMASINWKNLTPELRGAISSFEEIQFTEGRGEDAKPGRKVKVQSRDALRALEMLGKYLGMFTEKVQHSVDDDLVKRLEAGRNRVEKESSSDDNT